MKNERIISDFGTAVLEKEHLAAKVVADKWEAVSYETAAVKGTLLNATDMTWPKPVTVDPELEGWYRIYACLGQNGSARIDLQLTGNEFPSTVRCEAAPVRWNCYEVVGESLWKAADLTGKKVIISKPDDKQDHTASIFWLRFVPMTEAEVAEYRKDLADESRRTMLAHMDTDFHRCDAAKTPHDYCKALYAMKDSDVAIVSQEVSQDLMDFEAEDTVNYVGRSRFDGIRRDYWTTYAAQKDAIYTEQNRYAKEVGLQLFAATRVSLSSFAFAYDSPLFRIPFVEEHPELYCRSREGLEIAYLSYAYPETRAFAVKHLVDAVCCGFDGVTLLYTRGMHVLFEKPVLDRFAKKFGTAVDCRRLPCSDPRLQEVWADVTADFHRELRQALDALSAKQGVPKKKIYAAVFYTAEESKAFGVDVERLAKEGLIDGFIQSNMTVWEDLDGVLDETGLIDLEKYTRKADTEYVVKRSHGNELEHTLSGIPEYRRIADTYGVDYRTEIQWECTVPATEFRAFARTVYGAGAKGIALWDCYPARVNALGEWSCVSHFGSKERVEALSGDLKDYIRNHRVLSYRGKDIRHYHPSWKG